MKYQDAFIRVWNTFRSSIDCQNKHKEFNGGALIADDLDTLQELVQKVTPKYISCKGFKGMNYTRFYCPTCGKMLEFAEFGFCKHCGQALKYPKLEKIDGKLIYVYEDSEV